MTGDSDPPDWDEDRGVCCTKPYASPLLLQIPKLDARLPVIEKLDADLLHGLNDFPERFGSGADRPVETLHPADGADSDFRFLRKLDLLPPDKRSGGAQLPARRRCERT